MKTFLDEFKEFINRGNVVDLAVGVIIGGAFTSIVNSLVNDIIMPIIGVIIGGLDFSNLAITLSGDAKILIGSFIQNIINFIIIAFVVFNVVKLINKLKAPKPVEEAPAPEEPADIKLLKSIEKELKKLNKK